MVGLCVVCVVCVYMCDVGGRWVMCDVICVYRPIYRPPRYSACFCEHPDPCPHVGGPIYPGTS